MRDWEAGKGAGMDGDMSETQGPAKKELNTGVIEKLRPLLPSGNKRWTSVRYVPARRVIIVEGMSTALQAGCEHNLCTLDEDGFCLCDEGAHHRGGVVLRMFAGSYSSAMFEV